MPNPPVALKTNKHIRIGIYRHYKGGEYQIIDTVIHSETEETLVLYRPLYGESKFWVRPLAMFHESVQFNGKTEPRFKWVAETEKSQ